MRDVQITQVDDDGVKWLATMKLRYNSPNISPYPVLEQLWISESGIKKWRKIDLHVPGITDA